MNFVTRRYKNWVVFRLNFEFGRRLNHNVFIVFAFVFQLSKLLSDCQNFVVIRNFISIRYELAQAAFLSDHNCVAKSPNKSKLRTFR